MQAPSSAYSESERFKNFAEVFIEFPHRTTPVNHSQYFAHRPPSNTTLLHDPWPPEVPVYRARKPKLESRVLTEQGVARIRQAKSATGLSA